jgi:hypothetical protein
MRRLLQALLILVAIVVAAAGVARWWLAGDEGQAWLRGELSRKSGWDVGFAHLGGPLITGVDLDRPTLGSPDGNLRAGAERVEVRWSLRSLLDRAPDVRVHLSRPRVRLLGQPDMRQFAAPGHFPRRAHVEVTTDGGRLTASWDEQRVALDGKLRVGRGRVTLQGRGSPRRPRLRVAFRNLEPGLLPARDHMVLSGTARVSLQGRAARFTVQGRYRHRRIESQVPGSIRELPATGTVRAAGTVRLRPRLDARFVARVRDRGDAARLLGGPPEEIVLRGHYRKRLRMRTEAASLEAP